jgi:hypothetical protein
LLQAAGPQPRPLSAARRATRSTCELDPPVVHAAVRDAASANAADKVAWVREADDMTAR